MSALLINGRFAKSGKRDQENAESVAGFDNEQSVDHVVGQLVRCKAP